MLELAVGDGQIGRGLGGATLDLGIELGIRLDLGLGIELGIRLDLGLGIELDLGLDLGLGLGSRLGLGRVCQPLDLVVGLGHDGGRPRGLAAGV